MKKQVKLWLDSLAFDAAGVKRESGATGNYVWSDLTWDLSRVLPPHRIQELMKADSYTIKVEAIAWTSRTQLLTAPFLMKIQLNNESLYDARGGQTYAPLTMLRDNYDILNTRDQVGLHTSSKGWLTSRQLRIGFSKLDDAAFKEWEFAAAAAVTNATTSYVLALTIDF
jgi:hypothetical protein